MAVAAHLSSSCPCGLGKHDWLLERVPFHACIVGLSCLRWLAGIFGLFSDRSPERIRVLARKVFTLKIFPRMSTCLIMPPACEVCSVRSHGLIPVSEQIEGDGIAPFLFNIPYPHNVTKTDAGSLMFSPRVTKDLSSTAVVSRKKTKAPSLPRSLCSAPLSASSTSGSTLFSYWFITRLQLPLRPPNPADLLRSSIVTPFTHEDLLPVDLSLMYTPACA